MRSVAALNGSASPNVLCDANSLYVVSGAEYREIASKSEAFSWSQLWGLSPWIAFEGASASSGALHEPLIS